MKSSLIFKIIFELLLLYLSIHLLTSPQPWIFLDGVNLLTHESGHLIFQFAGEFMSIAGGTILQLLIPLIFLIYFISKQQLFSISFCFFWIGNNLVNISIYVKDASQMSLPLISEGSIHDWNYLLTRLDFLGSATLLGNIILGIAIMFFAANFVLSLLSLYIDYFNSR